MGLFENDGAEHACWKCEHWGGNLEGTSHARCERGGSVQVIARAEFGCAFWVRATGSDDDEDVPGSNNAQPPTRRRP
ncbi:hypothetical protein BGLT_02290 [Caballeronia glathei]|nr:hypothetical protein BGLT_02290 [Caballeronia glathei]